MPRLIMMSQAILLIVAILPIVFEFSLGVRIESPSRVCPLNAKDVIPYKVLNVTFESEGAIIVGRLFIPEKGKLPKPAVTVLGPFGQTKEMSPLQYASRIARDGLIALTWDPRGFGESSVGANAKLYESPKNRIADIKASIDFLLSRSEVDKRRIGGVGIDQAANYMIAAAVEDKRLKAIATASGTYFYKENMRSLYSGQFDEKLAVAEAAKKKFELTGQIDVSPIIDETKTDVMLPLQGQQTWFKKWLYPGSKWENQYATMSDADILSFDVEQYAADLKTPIIMLHGEHSLGGYEGVKRIFNKINTHTRMLALLDNVEHVQFYDDPIALDKTVPYIVNCFNCHFANVGN